MGISKISRTALIISVAFVFGLVNMSSALAQKRTLAELKVEVQTRADHNTYPLAGLSPDEVREALERLTTLDPNEWAASWSFLGDRYMAKAQGELPSSAAQADKDFIRAWRYYTIGRYPVPDSPGKEKAYEKALEAFLAHGRLLDPPLEVVHIPFESKEVIGYVQMPKGAKLAPMIVAIGGLDSRKEDMAEMFRSVLASGVGYLALDPPGAGQAPIKASPGAERMLIRAVDYAFQRPDVDKGRVAIYGSSLGGYWVTILAATEYKRARAVVALSPPVHYTFQRERTMAVPTNREYLMDYLEAQLFTYEGATDIETLAQVREKMSLKTRVGILDAPMAPMLVIGGALDTQVPVSDLELLLVSGQTPKEFWVNPQGRHTGRDSKEWSDARVFETVTVPWILRMLGVKAD